MSKLIALTPIKRNDQVLINVNHIIRVDRQLRGDDVHSIVFLTGYEGMNLSLEVLESLDDIMRLVNS